MCIDKIVCALLIEIRCLKMLRVVFWKIHEMKCEKNCNKQMKFKEYF